MKASLLCVLVLSAPLFETRPATTQAATTAGRPNIVFMLADDLGWADLGCYGSTFYESPYIDRLARQGVRFTQAYTAGSVCSPTRASIMTGKYPVRTGITDYLPGLHPQDAKLDTPYTRTRLAPDETTIAQSLKQHGYQTFYSGKWHLGEKGFGPGAYGFEMVVENAALGKAGKDPLVDDRLTDSALRFLDNRDNSRPFFMFLGYHAPHTPILEHPKYIQHFKDKAARLPHAPRESIAERHGQSRVVQNDPGYATEVAVLDDGVKRLDEKLQSLGLADSTIFIFFSDNGGLCTKGQAGPTSNLPLRSGKGWLYEGGIRVPLIIRAPGVARPGSVCQTPVISTDFFPTLLALAQAPLLPQQHLDGVSLVSLLRGGTPLPPRTLYWHYPHYHGSTWAPGSAVRDGDWKLIEFLEDHQRELYNLRDDLGEQHNLADKMPAKADELYAKLAAWRRQLHAAMPTPRAQSTTVPAKRP